MIRQQAELVPQTGIYVGHVYHKRHIPFEHDFKYRVFTLFCHWDELETLSKKLRFFSLNRFNLFSLFYIDHGARDGSNPKSWILNEAKKRNIAIDEHQIYALFFPRTLGYVFNPLTVFFCYDTQQNLVATVHQVKNTFGHQHSYFLPCEKKNSSGIIEQETNKVFHVSPFIEMDCSYHFRFSPPSQNLNFAIHQFLRNEKILTATWTGQFQDINDQNLFKNFLTHPLLTLKIITAIHWQALKLWIKGAKYIPVPKPPEHSFSPLQKPEKTP
jgi:uncharacterized protein